MIFNSKCVSAKIKSSPTIYVFMYDRGYFIFWIFRRVLTYQRSFGLFLHQQSLFLARFWSHSSVTLDFVLAVDWLGHVPLSGWRLLRFCKSLWEMLDQREGQLWYLGSLLIECPSEWLGVKSLLVRGVDIWRVSFGAKHLTVSWALWSPKCSEKWGISYLEQAVL